MCRNLKLSENEIQSDSRGDSSLSISISMVMLGTAWRVHAHSYGVECVCPAFISFIANEMPNLLAKALTLHSCDRYVDASSQVHNSHYICVWLDMAMVKGLRLA